MPSKLQLTIAFSNLPNCSNHLSCMFNVSIGKGFNMFSVSCFYTVSNSLNISGVRLAGSPPIILILRALAIMSSKLSQSMLGCSSASFLSEVESINLCVAIQSSFNHFSTFNAYWIGLLLCYTSEAWGLHKLPREVKL